MALSKLDLLQTTVGQLLATRAKEIPDRVYIRFEDKAITYGEFDRMVNQVANRLLAAGIRKGDRVGLFLDNSIEYCLLFWAIARVGAVMVPMNTGYPADELRYAVNHSEQILLFAHDHLRSVVEECRDQCTSLKEVVYVGGPEPNFETWLHGSTDTPVEVDVSPRDLLGVYYTSGTTARPKGVMLCHNSYVLGADFWCSAFECKEEDTLYGFFTLFHANNGIYLQVGAVLNGCTFAFRRGFSVREHWDLVQKFDATVFNSAGGISSMLAAQPPSEKDKAHRVRAVVNGINMGAEAKKAFEDRFGVVLLDAYSLTECLTGTIERLADVPKRTFERLKTIGRPSEWVEMKIVDDDGNELPPGEKGEICFKGPAVMLGYLNNPEETAKALKDGWLYTGDVGYVDGDGYLYYSDRKKDMIKHKGENVASAEVERVLCSHPSVQEAAVIGVPDPFVDEEIKAYIILKPGEKEDPWALIEHCRKYLEEFKVPRFIEFRDSFPRPTAVPKILKAALRAEKADLREGCFDRGPSKGGKKR